MATFLTSDTHIAAVGPDLVVLDVAQNAYYCLPGAAGAVAATPGGAVAFASEDLAGQFAQAGFIGPVEDKPRPRALLPRSPGRDLRNAGGGLPPRGARRDMSRALAAMAVGYWRRPLATLVQAAAHERPGARSFDFPGVAARASAFNHLLPWVPFQGECLFRAFMLLRFLRLGGHDATWVFGVRTWPFQAHCWLQSEDTVLDDLLDRVLPFTPILAV